MPSLKRSEQSEHSLESYLLISHFGTKLTSVARKNCERAGPSAVKKQGTPSTASPDTIRAMDLDLLFDYAAMRLNGQKAEGKSMKLNWNFTDTNQQYILELENEALSHIAGRQASDADATVTLTRAKLNDVLLGQTTFKKELDAGNISVAGNAAALNDLLSMLDSFDFWFNIVMPNEVAKQ
jgi:alkyl sulfatase BDS1-like metallo-beta-lactamase superfamily hydrolase